MRFKILTASLVLGLLTGCSCPDIVDTREIGDDRKTCAQLNQEIENCSKSKKELESEKGFTGKNVTAALFFWPALIATHSNVNDAVKALDDRKNHLMDIYKKKCSMHKND